MIGSIFYVKNVYTRSGIWLFISIRLIIWFCHLVKDFPFRNYYKLVFFVILVFTKNSKKINVKKGPKIPVGH